MRAARLALIAALLACALGGPLAGCGLKGALYLPQQKKAKVPPTPDNPAPTEPTAQPSTTSPPPASPPPQS
jgi:predicted small lipoprotein YifL